MTDPAPASTEWFYVDADRQQQGPVTRDALRELHARGDLRADSLVWQSGMEAWQPLQAALPDSGLAPAAIDPLPASASVMAAGAQIDRSDIVYAGFWRRVAAYWLDALIVGVASYVIILPLSMFMSLSMAGLEESADPAAIMMTLLPMMALMYLIIFGMQAVYFAWMHSRPAQATLGKMAVGIKVAGANGEVISFWRGFGRYFALLLALLPLYLGVFVIPFTERKRGLHDMLCDTVVVDRWAYTDRPNLQKRGLDGVTIAVLVIGALIVLVVIGVMVLMAAVLGGG